MESAPPILHSLSPKERRVFLCCQNMPANPFPILSGPHLAVLTGGGMAWLEMGDEGLEERDSSANSQIKSIDPEAGRLLGG